MATEYEVDITMTTDTVNALVNGNYYLYGFKAVGSTIGGGAPLVWFETKTFSTNTQVQWETQYQAYTSKSQIIPNGQIVASFDADIDLDQVLQVNSSAGTGDVSSAGGVASAISILNQTSSPFTCGISEVQDGKSKSLCAFPLYGHGLDVIAPIEKVLLMFATLQVNTGTVIEKAFSSSYLIDLTGAPDNERSVTFDINAGWSNGGGTWAQQYQPNAELAPILIDTSGAMVTELRKQTRERRLVL